ncbi:MAG: T9SS type A sorting domain-containing protein, partial [Ignavibacteria bacterium]|nr:T9SS type A sorting domain-containing protein [Ignavibacteria bacterium]
TLKVYDLLGREVATLVDEYQQPGNYKVRFNVETRHGSSLHSGVYFYKFTVNGFSQSKKMLLMK